MGRLRAIVRALGVLVQVAAAAAPARAAIRFQVTNLVTDDPQANAAQITDANLVNAWGISYGPGSPFWVSAGGSGKSTIYFVDPATNATQRLSPVVSIPGDGSVTGQVFDATAHFDLNAFLFVSEDGTVSGWRMGSTATVCRGPRPRTCTRASRSLRSRTTRTSTSPTSGPGRSTC